MKEIIKNFKYLLKHYPLLIRCYRNAMFVKHAFNSGFWRALMKPIFHWGRTNLCQSVMKWEVNLPEFQNPYEMVVWLQREGIRFNEGKHTIYLPPQEKLLNCIPFVVGFYPPDSGFKILKDFRPPAEANYVGLQSRFSLHSKLIGRPQDQLISANFLYSFDLGARVWDVTTWKTSGMSFTVFVVAHVEGHFPSISHCIRFKKRLEEILKGSHLSFVHPEWDKLEDFKCPSCNGNLLQSNESERPKYIDFQNFVMNNPRAWSNEIFAKAKNAFRFDQESPFLGEEHLHYSVAQIARSGKQSILKRWHFILKELQRAGINLDGRVVLDVSCNAGMIIYLSLVEGAAWGLGWDRSEITGQAQKLLLSLGCSRFFLKSAELGPAYDLRKDIPFNLLDRLSESVVFYHSFVQEQMGPSGSLEKLPCRVLIYEGRQQESTEEMRQILSPLITDNMHLLFSLRISDGESSFRPICILVRRKQISVPGEDKRNRN